MRQLCSFDGEIQAQQFAAYLFLMGIHTTIDVETTADAPALSNWVVWIVEEDDLVQAQEELERFLQNPGDPCYENSVQQAGQQLKKEAEQRQQIQKKQVNMQSQWKRRPASSGRPLTMTLLLVCVGVFLFSGAGKDMEGTTMRALQFVDQPAAKKRSLLRIGIAEESQKLNALKDNLQNWKERLQQDTPEVFQAEIGTRLLYELMISKAQREKRKPPENLGDKLREEFSKVEVDGSIAFLSQKLVLEEKELSRHIDEVNRQAKAINLSEPSSPATLSREIRELGNIENGKPTDRYYDLRAGQVWRIVTPIFIHLGVMHLLFNMIWLYQLGGVLEGRYKSASFGGLVLFTGIAGVLAQCCMPYEMPFDSLNGGVLGGGMSGVVFGLLGFAWIKTRSDPASGLVLRGNIFGFMMIWLVLGFSGILDSLVGGSIANWAHGGGLVAGMLLGYLSIRRR